MNRYYFTLTIRAVGAVQVRGDVITLGAFGGPGYDGFLMELGGT